VLVVEPDYLPDSVKNIRSLLSAKQREEMFIPHEDFTPQKYVHSSTMLVGGVQRGVPPLHIGG
jgi:hypothetical protein